MVSTQAKRNACSFKTLSEWYGRIECHENTEKKTNLDLGFLYETFLEQKVRKKSFWS